ncbi:hypothetical protein BOX15_Mlig007256g1 [Macrostomum lignano]|uniref:Uncharacterized protein n=1 Tax=Macrostomum lignano TaxID=282301 RepID=A0A267EMP5_9PLAT|nr:hypothetical protein BOX15_Mlig007256g1 [Macrostomum lignano]
MQPVSAIAICTLCFLVAATSAGLGAAQAEAGSSDCRLSPRELSRTVTSLYRNFLIYLEAQGETTLELGGPVKRGPAKRKDKYVWRL